MELNYGLDVGYQTLAEKSREIELTLLTERK